MAEAPFPAVAGITALSIAPWHPGQITHTSPFSGTVQVLDRGAGTWRGTVDIAQTRDDAEGSVIETFLASLGGMRNWCRLPLVRHRPGFAIDRTATVTALVNQRDGVLAHRVTLDAGAFQVGDWVVAQSTGARVFVVRTASSRAVTLAPQIPLEVDDRLTIATHIRARAASERLRPSRRTPDGWGPWSWDWQEAL